MTRCDGDMSINAGLHVKAGAEGLNDTMRHEHSTLECVGLGTSCFGTAHTRGSAAIKQTPPRYKQRLRESINILNK